MPDALITWTLRMHLWPSVPPRLRLSERRFPIKHDPPPNVVPRARAAEGSPGPRKCSPGRRAPSWTCWPCAQPHEYARGARRGPVIFWWGAGVICCPREGAAFGKGATQTSVLRCWCQRGWRSWVRSWLRVARTSGVCHPQSTVRSLTVEQVSSCHNRVPEKCVPPPPRSASRRSPWHM